MTTYNRCNRYRYSSQHTYPVCPSFTTKLVASGLLVFLQSSPKISNNVSIDKHLWDENQFVMFYVRYTYDLWVNVKISNITKSCKHSKITNRNIVTFQTTLSYCNSRLIQGNANRWCKCQDTTYASIAVTCFRKILSKVYLI